jgi:hypothetical protein
MGTEGNLRCTGVSTESRGVPEDVNAVTEFNSAKATNSSARGWRFTLFCESRTERILYTTRRMLDKTPSKAVSL